MNFYLATSNDHKITEFRRLLADRGLTGISVRGAAELGGMPPVAETASGFAGNARLKARALRERAGRRGWVLADDSGLEVDALAGAPGVRSARYAGENASDPENNARLLRELEGVSPECRTARFRCCLVLISPDAEEFVFEGSCEGRIAEEASGTAGFGYDPLFVPEGRNATFAALRREEKDRLSHRARAWEKLAAWLEKRSIIGRDDAETKRSHGRPEE